MNSRHFSLTDVPLDPGTRLLEANAGTGKTYTICGLVCRLVVEEGLEISKILMVTFTEAATNELKERVREYLQKTLTELLSGEIDGELALIYSQLPADQRDQAIRRLKTAVATFNEAPTFTIHGFCNQVLNQYAFESNQLFEPELLKDPRPLYLETCRDYWRRHFYRGHPFLAAVVHCLGATPESLVEDFNRLSRWENLQVVPPAIPELFDQTLAALRKAWEIVSFAFQDTEEIFKILGDGSRFKAGIKKHLPEIKWFLGRPWPDTPSEPIANVLKHLSISNLTSNATKKALGQGFDLSHPAFEAAENWQMALEEFGHQHRFYFLADFKEQLERRKIKGNVLTFDDLLPRVLNILEGPAGESLKSRLQSQYAAALIDEFQDTDPQQNRLFKLLFTSPRHRLYLIGDLKQAIYTFRSADIFSYIEARNSAREIYFLTKNWRSRTKLVNGINRLFQRHETPFAFPQIDFHPSDSANKGHVIKDASGRDGTGLQVAYLQAEDFENQITKEDAQPVIRAAVVQEILSLLNGGDLIDGRSIQPGDLAILTRTNDEAREMKAELTDMNLPCVLSSEETIFSTEEAKTLRVLLYALSEPNRKDWLKAVMASEWMGHDAQHILTMNEVWESSDDPRQFLHACHNTWLAEGIFPTVQAWLSHFDVIPRLLRLPEGQHKVTNLTHLVELLQKAESEGHSSPQTLLIWYEDTMEEPDPERDDFQLRMETDGGAVKVLTIHKSKGLQYPIVFVPFAWAAISKRKKKEGLVYHDPSDTSQVILDARPEPCPIARTQHYREELSDRLRLLYVALTRAQSRSYLFWGNFKDQNRSPIGYLLGMTTGPDGKPNPPPLEAWKAFKAQAPEGIRIRDVREMARGEKPPYKLDLAQKKLSAKRFSRTLEPGFGISSFSSITAGLHEAIEARDESSPKEPKPAPEQRNIFALPRGVITGNVIHRIYQNGNFQKEETLLYATREACRDYYGGTNWFEILFKQLKQVLETPLKNPFNPVILNQIPPEACLKEAEFHFSARNCHSRELTRILQKYPENFSEGFNHALPHLRRQKIHGFLRGFIDLVFEHKNRFYLLDWKSNWLGSSAEDYGPSSLRKAMGAHAYFLQYYLYTVALTRYLQKRLPSFDYDRDFGGVYYLFVRGMEPESESNGIYYDKPPRHLIEEIDRLFSKQSSS